MSSASLEVQKAVFVVLDSLSGFEVYDHVPQGAPYPYVEIGESTLVNDDTKSEDGEEHTLTLHHWSRGKGRAEVKQMMSDAQAALHRQTLTLTGYSAWPVTVEFAQALRDADGQTYHGVQRLRVRTQPL